MSVDILIKKIKKLSNPSVVGLDPKLEYIPNYIVKDNIKIYGETLKAAAASIYHFNKKIIDAIYDIVPAVKPQSAYYEMYGYEGVKCLKQTIDYAKEKGMYVITDVKRNDIGTTAQAYSNAYIGSINIGKKVIFPFDSDSVTVNGYLGSDGLTPFIENCNKNGRSIFVLVKTSNNSSGELQDLKCEDKYIYEYMAELVNKLGRDSIGDEGYNNVGAVVGATYPSQAEKLRMLLPNTFFLVPGYGAQGGGGKDVAVCFNSDGLGAIVNSSRGIICAYKNENIEEERFAEAARNAAIKMKKEITSYI